MQFYSTVIAIIQFKNLSAIDVDSKNVLINTFSPQPHILKRVYIPVINIYIITVNMTTQTSIDSKPN